MALSALFHKFAVVLCPFQPVGFRHYTETIPGPPRHAHQVKHEIVLIPDSAGQGEMAKYPTSHIVTFQSQGKRPRYLLNVAFYIVASTLSLSL